MMQVDRRNLLAGLAMLPLIGIPAAGLLKASTADATGVRLVADLRFPGGQALALAAREQGLPLIDPAGEIIALFLGEGASWLRTPGPIIGLTSYTDMMLMRDVARQAGRSMHVAVADGQSVPLRHRLTPSQERLLTSLRDAPVARRQARTFIWLV